uniref:Pentatricopeptide repeat superfamily protein, putative isoform 1 n=1 Tax=Albuca bracteata TaxID=82047 RepID=A0A0A7LUJ5_ALBBR|nr:pentatricopeptide repeat superfamily protein, putative isoform 1 [Albuca bracteata]
MSIAIIPYCVVEPSSSSSSSCRPRRNLINFSISSSSSRRFGARRKIPLRAKNRSARIRAVSENLGSLPDPLASSSNNRYHPSEDIGEPASQEGTEDARLTDAEIGRTLVEVNSKATLMFSGLSDDEIHENVIWPDLPYLTDEHGDIYFEVNNNEDILQTLIGDDKIVQVIIGLDNIEMLEEMEISGPPDYDFGMEEMTSEESDIDDDSDEDVFAILDDEEDDLVSSESSTNWTNLDTMQSSHPMYFARKISEVVTSTNLDWMDQPSASIVMQGVLRPAFAEEHSFIKKHLSVGGSSNDEVPHHGKIVEEKIKDALDKDRSLHSEASFYKLDMISIQLVSAYGTQSSVEVQDFRKAQPDDVVNHAAEILSQLKAGGDKTIEALKSLCWRLKGIKVEEATVIGVDSLGFDLRVCSGTQVQTLRFAFRTRATTELNAERQLHDLLFPRSQHKNQT